jgi:C4-dicarboxylate-specific signal transduction histidine kinase
MRRRSFSLRQPWSRGGRYLCACTLFVSAAPLIAQAEMPAAAMGADPLAAPSWRPYLPFVVAAVAILLQGALINWLFLERRRRRHFETEARETLWQLAYLNRVANAGELTASIAHELTQPITGMVTSANAALRWLAGPTPQLDKARNALAQVVSAGDRTGEIIHGIRAMFRKEPAARRSVNMNDLIRGVLALVQGDLERHRIALETELGNPAAPVICDPIQLQQVLLNAIESMSRLEARPRALRLCTTYSARDVLVSVADGGPGIHADDVKRIFKPMYTTKPQGMGMGLAICRSIVEAHNGHIWVSSDDSGTVFHFVLPTHA